MELPSSQPDTTSNLDPQADPATVSSEQAPATVELLTFFVAGVKYRPPEVIDRLTNQDVLKLEAEPSNPYDEFAVKVLDLLGNLVGYCPKKQTWILHFLRKAGVPLSLSLSVNKDARPDEQLCVRVMTVGNPDQPFICT